jgi:uncharacterized protein (TIGR00266 family)
VLQSPINIGSFVFCRFEAKEVFMQQTIEFSPAFAMATVELAPGESLTVEAGSMVGMSDGMIIKTGFGSNLGGFFSRVSSFFMAVIRKIFAKESFFLNTYTPPVGQGGKVLFAPAISGDITHYEMAEGRALMVQASSYLASAGAVRVKTKFGGFKSLFSGEGAFWLHASGSGDLWVNSYGAIHAIDVQGSFIVDTGHIVAYEDSLTYKIKTAGGFKATLMSGEGLVCEFLGHGKLYIQTRDLGATIGWILPRLKS